MSQSAVTRLLDAQRALLAALDGTEIDAIEAANAQLQDAVAALRAADGWHAAPDVRADLVTAARLGDANRIRAGYHGDRTRRRLAALAVLRRPTGIGASYGRNGRFKLPAL